MLMPRSHMISGITCLLLATVSSAATLKSLSEQRYTEKTFDDRTEHYGVYRGAISTIFPNVPQSSAVYFPLTVSMSNLDRTYRGTTAELIRSDFAGHTQSLGRVGDADSLIALDNNNILVQTSATLAKISLFSQEEVWKIVLPNLPGQNSNVRVGDNGYIYIQDNQNRFVLKVNAANGAVERQVKPLEADVGQYWGLTRVFKNGQMLIFGDNRYTAIDENGSVKWRGGKVFPQKSYGDARVVGELTLLSEYISSSNPDPKLARRTAHTLIKADGTEVWSRTESFQYLTQDVDQLYFADYSDLQRVKLVAVSASTGKTIWSKDLQTKRDVLTNAVAGAGRVVLGQDNEVRVFAAEDGAQIVRRSWADRSQTKILSINGVRSINGLKIVTASTGKAAPNDQFVDFLELDESAQ